MSSPRLSLDFSAFRRDSSKDVTDMQPLKGFCLKHDPPNSADPWQLEDKFSLFDTVRILPKLALLGFRRKTPPAMIEGAMMGVQ
mmetsp:Transcript_4524/g.6699  ORF Transcript_4524/g.6699 Transcript_4524/m.6699 type:complete len:84 (+) Transcript_4524:377-628(+)